MRRGLAGSSSALQIHSVLIVERSLERRAFLRTLNISEEVGICIEQRRAIEPAKNAHH